MISPSHWPTTILTVRPGPYLEAGWQNAIHNMTIACKICDGASAYTSTPRSIIDAARLAGRPIWGWGYHYLSRWRPQGGAYVQAYATDLDSARAEAKAAAGAARLWRVNAYSCNAEHVAFGAWGAPLVQSAAETAQAFAEMFRALAPGVDLLWNGIGWELYQNTAGQTQKGLNGDAMRHFTAYQPMLYKLGPDTAARRASTLSAWLDSKAKADRWQIPFAPMVATGALRANGDAWAWHFDKGGQPGLVSLAARTLPQAVAIFYGDGSAPMLTLGNTKNAALCRLAPWLEEARAEGLAGTWTGTPDHPEMTPGPPPGGTA